MVGMALFSIVAVGVMHGSLSLRYQAEKNLYQIMAHTAVQGYLEQMKNLPYERIFEETIPTEALCPETNEPRPDPLTPNIPNLKFIDINGTPGDLSDDLNLWITPRVERLTDGEGAKIILDVEWAQPMGRGEPVLQNASVRVIRTPYNTF